ncbi:MAG: histidine phosphatase family protein [Sneathiellaceae bacterium]
MALRLFWVRHGPVLGRKPGVIYGSEDVGIEVPVPEAPQALARYLPADADWLISPMRRTLLTAEAILAHADHRPELKVVPEIAEQYFGTYKGLTNDEALALAGGVRDNHHWPIPLDHCPPEGESYQDVHVRVGRILDRWASEHSDRNIVAVAHGGPIKSALAHVLEVPLGAVTRILIDNFSVTRMHRLPDGHWRVEGVNLLPWNADGYPPPGSPR